jgi:hypothetical protein
MPRCKICKTKFESKYFNQKTCTNVECVLKQSKEVKLENYSKLLRKNKTTPTAKKITPKESLQNEVNKLAKKIDAHFEYDCICCGNVYKGQRDAAHFKSRGANSNLAFNLHNIHTARAYCNQYSNLHISGYENGLIERYGQEYFDMVNEQLGVQYSYLGLNETEIKEALKIVRKLNREFETHTKGNDLDGAMMRSYFNNLINIYK